MQFQQQPDRAPLSIFLPTLLGGGAERVAITLASALVARGERVDLVVGNAEGPYRGDVPEEVQLIDLRSPRVSRCLPGLVRYLRIRRPRALISELSEANVVACCARLIARVKTRVIVTEHNSLSHDLADAGSRATLFKLVLGATYLLADAIVGVSCGVSRDLESSLGLKQNSVTTIYNPIVKTPLAPTVKAPRREAIPLIVAAGRLNKQKDYPTLLQAFAQLRETRLAELVILGEGPLRSELEQMCVSLGIADDVCLPGFSNELTEWMSKADLFVLSSAWEGFGNVLVEAMACGTPVVSTDCPSGPAEILENGKWGRLVPVGDAPAMAAAMAASLEEADPPDVKTRAAAFSVDRAVDAYLALIDPKASQIASPRAAGASASGVFPRD